jgi:acetyltransferase-like isoleucine patch superfamily enzyme
MKALKTIGFAKAFRFIWYSFISQMLHLVIIPQIRSNVMKWGGARIGADTIIGDVSFANLYHYGFSRIQIGDRCFIGDEVMIDARGGIDLGNDVTVSNRTNLVTHINVGYVDHPLQKNFPLSELSININHGSYIGTGAMILPGVIIGPNAVVGAGAVVTRDVREFTVVAGVPARMIRKLKVF